ncbi:hypothetical protein M513_11462 [Trichuris suis]|uniref:Histone H2A C-terminal domain-containing protein n=1 Tax=Trichuris suis TaxID=68888 RepID=A0A085LRS5_9BILA|nr:hypothetical protein M513_11462 [Trichuris suis]
MVDIAMLLMSVSQHEKPENKNDKYGSDGGIYRRPDQAFTNQESKCELKSERQDKEPKQQSGINVSRWSHSSSDSVTKLYRANWNWCSSVPCCCHRIFDDRKNSYHPAAHLQLAIRSDEELSNFLRGVTIAQGGVLPNIHPSLRPTKSEMKAAKKA